MASRKCSISPQEDEGLADSAVEDLTSGSNVGDCIVNATGTGKEQVKIIYSGKGYLSDSLTAFLSLCSTLSTVTLFGLVSRLKDLLDSPLSKLLPETEILVTHKQSFLTSFLPSLLVGRNVGTNHISPFLQWLQARSKVLHATDHSIGQVTIADLGLYCSLTKLFAGQTLHLLGMKRFKLQNFNFPKNQLRFRVGGNKDEESKKKRLECERLTDRYLQTDVGEQEGVQIMDNAKVNMEAKLVTSGQRKRRRKIYKLAPTFQHPRILSTAQITTLKKSCGEGASDLYTGTDTMHNQSIGDLTRRDRSAQDVEGIHEDDLYPVTSKCSGSPENSGSSVLCPTLFTRRICQTDG